MRLKTFQLSKKFARGGGLRDLFRGKRSTLAYALSGIEFELAPCSIAALIGPNGSGKSTLLRVLSRTTCPSNGAFSIDGKLVSVLGMEGALHPDFEVSEAVHLQMALAGINGREASRRMDAVLAFAGLSSSQGICIKALSSGTRVRLLMSIVLHADWDILLIDEALSALDLEFRWKCEAKIKKRTAAGASVLLVSHDWEWVSRFCDQAIYLSAGKIVDRGRAEEVISRRLDRLSSVFGKQRPSHSDLENENFSHLVQSHEKETPTDRV